MTLQHFLTTLVAAGALWFCGCNSRNEEAVAANPESDEIQLFEKGKGLRLPDEMQRALGVVTVEVTERPMRRQVEKPAHLYRAGDASKPAAAIAWLDQTEAALLRPGQSVALRTSQAEMFSGTLVQLVPGLTNLRGQSEAIIEFPDEQQRVPGGAMVTAIFSASTNAVTAIPVSAVVRSVESTFVYTVSGAHFVRTPVKMGMESDGWMEITDGLYAGDVVVARAVDALWTIELCALKGGTPCCPVGKRPGRHDD
jgi:hypothetical protein